jgi:hypothetical protein
MSVKSLVGGIVLTASVLSAVGPADADGTAKATVTVAEGTFTYSGGSCTANAGGLVVNIGEHAPSAGGARPDYFGASIAKVPGHFENAVISFVKDGKRYSVGTASGVATANGGSFSGTLIRGGGTVKGSFSC